MNKARVELLVGAEMIEGLEPMAVVEVGVTAEHLTVQTFYVVFVRAGEAAGLTKPLSAYAGGDGASVRCGSRLIVMIVDGRRGAGWNSWQ